MVLNSKSEFHQAPIRRVVTTAGLQALQGEEQGWVAVRGRGAARSTGRGARGTTRSPGGATSAARGDRGAGGRPGEIRESVLYLSLSLDSGVLFVTLVLNLLLLDKGLS